MKTTNFEVSKKLKEIGFNVETEYYWHDINGKTELHHVAREGLGDYKSYDLETIFDVLPECIKRSCREYYLFLQVPTKKLGYYDGCNEYMGHYCMGEEDGIFEVSKLSSNESLADTAGRLLIKLFEAGIVNFNK